MERSLYAQIRSIEGQHWWYVGRRRIVFDWVRRVVAARPRARVLDIGCGTGRNLEELHRLGVARAIGLDLSVDALDFCRDRGLTSLVRADGTRPPFADGSFDVVLALDLIEHLERDESALAEIARVLAPDGALVVFTPAFRFLWSLQDEVSHHFRRYTAGELRSKLRRAGFDVEKLSYANTFMFPAVWAGRTALKFQKAMGRTSENDLHPAWSNGMLSRIFSAEAPLLRYVTFPFGVSLLAVARRSRR